MGWTEQRESSGQATPAILAYGGAKANHARWKLIRSKGRGSFSIEQSIIMVIYISK